MEGRGHIYMRPERGQSSLFKSKNADELVAMRCFAVRLSHVCQWLSFPRMFCAVSRKPEALTPLRKEATAAAPRDKLGFQFALGRVNSSLQKQPLWNSLRVLLSVRDAATGRKLLAAFLMSRYQLSFCKRIILHLAPTILRFNCNREMGHVTLNSFHRYISRCTVLVAPTDFYCVIV